MKRATKLLAAIDRSWTRKEEPRTYLGASILGDSCARALWYNFRWAAEPYFPPRVLRLFDRGNREEVVFEQLLLEAGVEFWPIDPATQEQYLVTFRNKHLGGHADGIGRGLPDLPPNEHFLCEWKTHAEKSFKDLVKKGVQQSKPIHNAQMQLYMSRLGLNWALYGAVNKNDDTLHFEIVEHNPDVSKGLEERGNFIVNSATPPDRISQNPGWYECRFCDYHSNCHKRKPLDVSCRSCQLSEPLVNGDWWCGLHDSLLSKSEQLAGCQDHVAIQ